MRLELTTSAVTGRRSNQLSHQAIFKVPKVPSRLHTSFLKEVTSLLFKEVLFAKLARRLRLALANLKERSRCGLELRLRLVLTSQLSIKPSIY